LVNSRDSPSSSAGGVSRVNRRTCPGAFPICSG
jgi:hypothetical protein